MSQAWSRRSIAGFGGCVRGRTLSHAVGANTPRSAGDPASPGSARFLILSPHCGCRPHLSHLAVALPNVAGGELKKNVSCHATESPPSSSALSCRYRRHHRKHRELSCTFPDVGRYGHRRHCCSAGSLELARLTLTNWSVAGAPVKHRWFGLRDNGNGHPLPLWIGRCVSKSRPMGRTQIQSSSEIVYSVEV